MKRSRRNTRLAEDEAEARPPDLPPVPDEDVLDEPQGPPIELAERTGWRMRLSRFVRSLARLAPSPRNPISIFGRALARLLERDMSLVAAGMSFFSLLAIFPAVVFATTLIGLLTGERLLEGQITVLTSIIPPGARSVVAEQIASLARQPMSSLTVQGLLAIVVALWSSSRGLKGLVAGLNVLQGRRTHRGFFTFQVFGVLITCLAFAIAIVLQLLATVLPPVLSNLGVPMEEVRASGLLRWGPAGLAMWILLSIVYRYGMAVEQRMAWRWSMVGAFLGLLFWLGVTVLFSEYVRYVTFYNQLYGSLSALALFLLWLYVSAYAILLGGALVAILHETYSRGTRQI